MAKFRADLNKDNFITGDVVCAAGMPMKVGEYKVQAGEVLGLGFLDGGMADALGRIYMDVKDNTPAAIEGTIRLQVANAQDFPLATVFEMRTENLRQGLTDYKSRIPFNESELNTRATEDKKIQIIFISDLAKTFSKTNTTLFMSCNRQYI